MTSDQPQRGKRVNIYLPADLLEKWEATPRYERSAAVAKALRQYWNNERRPAHRPARKEHPMKAHSYVQRLTIQRLHDDGSVDIALPAVGDFDGFTFHATLAEREAAQVAVGRQLINDTRVFEHLATQELKRRGIDEV